MNAVVSVDTRNFEIAFRLYLAHSSRTLPKAINARMFFVLLRTYLILGPKEPAAVRKRYAESLMQMVRAKGGKQREVQKIYAIINSKRHPGLYGKEMSEAVRKLRARTLGGVGYLKSVIVRGIRKFQGFRQFGTKRVKSGKYGGANKAAISLAAQYDHKLQSVAIYRRSNPKAIANKAVDGFMPVARCQLQAEGPPRIGSNGQRILNKAVIEALQDEQVEMVNYLRAKLGESADQLLASRGFKVVE